MANRTAASKTSKGSGSRGGSGTRSTKSGSSSRSRSSSRSAGSGRSRSTTRRPPPRRQSGGLGRAVGRGLRGGFLLLAKGVGGIARTMGRTKDLDAAHRRDGLAFALIAVGVIAGAGIWWHASGPVGHSLEFGVRPAIGASAMALPMVLLVVGITLMRSDPQPEKRPRLVIGSLLFVMAFLGILHLFSDLPEDNAGRMYAGGALGYVSGGMLAKGVTAWVAIPLLVLVIVFGVLVFTGTRFRDIPTRLRELGMEHDDEDYEEGIDLPGEEEAAPAAETKLRRPSRRRQATMADGAGGAEPALEPGAEDVPPPPEPPATP